MLSDIGTPEKQAEKVRARSTQQTDMTPEQELKLSFYRQTAVLNEAHRVFLVQHVETGRFFVKKTVRQYDLRIYEALQQGQFAGIPAIHELVEADDELIIIEEYISGNTVQAMLERGPLAEEDACRMLSALCDILAPLHAHEPPIIHRDIKGSNLVVDEHGQLFLLDFDASKIADAGKTQDTVLMGTEEYAAPEQYGFAASDARTDIYALGVLFNVMLTGHFPKEQVAEGYLGVIVKKCTAWEPDNRFHSVEALKKALQRRRNPIRKVWEAMPGVRSGKAGIAVLWWIVLGVLAYFALTTVYVLPDGSLYAGVPLWITRFEGLMSFWLTAFYLTNYMGWRERFPLKKRDNAALEVLRITAGALLAFFVPLLLPPW